MPARRPVRTIDHITVAPGRPTAKKGRPTMTTTAFAPDVTTTTGTFDNVAAASPYAIEQPARTKISTSSRDSASPWQ